MAEIDEEWDITILAISRQVSRQYSMVDAEDVAQQLRLWWLQQNRRVSEYLEDVTEERVGVRKLLRALNLEAKAFCQREKAAAAGYNINDLFFYNTAALRELLPLVFDYEQWVLGVGPDDGQPRAKSNPAEGNNLTAALVDLKVALERLNDVDSVLLEQLYRDGFSEQELAESAGITAESMNKRHDRALGRLRDLLGGERPDFHDGPGARRAMSNAQARSLVD